MALNEILEYTAAGVLSLTAMASLDWYRSQQIEGLGDRLAKDWAKTKLTRSDCPYPVGLLSFCSRQRYKRLYRDIERQRGY
ncbi:MAG TPA: hypothetical protein VJA18_02160 [Candidatus Nanoarchaeia archaeon]|nr:hypothetical protein [Candidatus Nanoarchaeia archaeon]